MASLLAGRARLDAHGLRHPRHDITGAVVRGRGALVLSVLRGKLVELGLGVGDGLRSTDLTAAQRARGMRLDHDPLDLWMLLHCWTSLHVCARIPNVRCPYRRCPRPQPLGAKGLGRLRRWGRAVSPWNS